ncbi:unnamed protein product [Vicia faba]|uniref:Uncharacterized protein n=1 Tax=Vicia faba TaxID=3906 RepID=A0AAV0YGJ2_VICFA|nr:unnamed protein product [Vicia faba]
MYLLRFQNWYKVYVVFDLSTTEIFISRNAVFYESTFPYADIIDYFLVSTDSAAEDYSIFCLMILLILQLATYLFLLLKPCLHQLLHQSLIPPLLNLLLLLLLCHLIFLIPIKTKLLKTPTSDDHRGLQKLLDISKISIVNLNLKLEPLPQT